MFHKRRIYFLLHENETKLQQRGVRYYYFQLFYITDTDKIKEVCLNFFERNQLLKVFLNWRFAIDIGNGSTELCCAYANCFDCI